MRHTTPEFFPEFFENSSGVPELPEQKSNAEIKNEPTSVMQKMFEKKDTPENSGYFIYVPQTSHWYPVPELNLFFDFGSFQ